jgi:hypothetical protein
MNVKSVIFLLFIFKLCLIKINAQSLSPSQKEKIRAEQQKLKENKITYEEYQKRYYGIISASSETATDTLPKSVILTPPETQNSLKIKSTIIRPGDELITFGKKFYTGIGLTFAGLVFIALGTVNNAANTSTTRGRTTNRTTISTSATSLLFIGTGTMLAGTTFSILSFKHIRRAGALLNQNNDN